jgi:hypothetical protein
MLTERVGAFGLYKVGACPGYSYWSGPDNSNVNSGAGYAQTPYDPFGGTLMFYENVSNFINLMSLAGHPVDDISSMTRTWQGARPWTDPLSYFSKHKAWGHYVNNLRHAFTDFVFSQASGIHSENPINHLNLFGEVVSGSDASQFFRQPLIGLYEEEGYHIPDTRFSLSDGATVMNMVPRSVLVDSAYPIGYLRGNIGSLASSADSGEFDQPGSTRYFDVNYQTDGDMVTMIEYKLDSHRLDGPFTHRSVIKIRHRFYFVLTSAFAEFGLTLPLSSLVQYVSDTYHFVLQSGVYVTGSDPGDLWDWEPSLDSDFSYTNSWSPNTFFVHSPAVPSRLSELIGYSPGRGYEYGLSEHSLSSFWATVRQILPDAYPAAFLSSKKAVDKHLERMESNHLEALLELGDLLRLVDLVGAFYSLKLNPKKLRFSYVLRLLDLLADSKLTYSLGIAPTISDAKDVAARSANFLKKFNNPDLFGPNTIYGKFSYLVPPELSNGFDGLRLVARSKIRISVNPDSYLTAMLPVRSLGLMPSLSSIWDIIPFSFVIDQFLHVGSNLDDVDTQLMFLALNCENVVHSLSYIYSFTEEDQESYDFVTVSDGLLADGAGYKFYSRFVESTLPTLGPTRFRFHGDTPTPDWVLDGALLFKLLK